MKKLQLLILLSTMVCASQHTFSQVFAHPGATWLFYSSGFGNVCFERFEIWEYTGDAVINGDSVKTIHVTNKQLSIFSEYQTYEEDKYFKVSGDTVSLYNDEDNSWQELYNFSLQVGDSVRTPLGNILNPFAVNCTDSVPYKTYAIIVNTGSTVIFGESLRFYTLKYRTGADTTHAYQTYYERIITTDYWHPNDTYWCGAVAECSQVGFACYKDNDMFSNSACLDLDSVRSLALEEPMVDNSVHIYPNPASDFLYIGTTGTEIINYRILSVDGKYIGMYKLNSGGMDVSGLAPGIYIVTNEAGTFYRKFVKE